MKIINPLLLLVLWLGCVDAIADASPFTGAHRTPEFVARDSYRHPVETLAFFQVEPGMTVARFTAKLAADPTAYGDVILSTFDPANGVLTVPDGVADRVVTFRNVHNWLRSDSEGKAFELFFRALKPGGVLGVVEHRTSRTIDRAEMVRSGYMPEAYVIELAEKAGFVLAAKSELNANPKDTTDHPEGVWTLPPSLRLQEKDREKYQAIGESDRMTLKFIKPAAP